MKAYTDKTGTALDETKVMIRNPNFDIGQLIKDFDKV